MPYNKNIRGWMTEHELSVLEGWAAELSENSTIVEVGSFYGRSAYCFATSTSPGTNVYCFDRWYGDVAPADIDKFSIEVRNKNGFPLPGMVNSMENFLNNTSELKNIIPQRVENYQGIKWEHGRIVDLFFIDAAHFNPSDWEYITFWMQYVKPGAYICGHDYYKDSRIFEDINNNVRELERIFNTTAETYTGTSLWRIKT